MTSFKPDHPKKMDTKKEQQSKLLQRLTFPILFSLLLLFIDRIWRIPPDHTWWPIFPQRNLYHFRNPDYMTEVRIVMELIQLVFLLLISWGGYCYIRSEADVRS